MPTHRAYPSGGQVYARPAKSLLPGQPAPLLLQSLIAIWGGIFLFLVFLLIIILTFRISNANRIYPGISVGGVDLSGLKKAEAELRLTESLRYPEEGTISLRYNDKTWSAKPRQLGLSLIARDSVEAALRWGRRGGVPEQILEQFQAWYEGVDLPPVFVFDEGQAQAYLYQIDQDIQVPVRDAALEVQGTGIVVRPSQEGRTLDRAASLDILRKMMLSQKSGSADLVVQTLHPAIVDVTHAAEIARSMLSSPLTLAIPNARPDDPPPWRVEVNDLARMLKVERSTDSSGEGYRVHLDVNLLKLLLQNAATKLARSSQDARYTFNEETKQLDVFQPAVIGRSLSMEKTLSSISESLNRGEHRVELAFDSINPKHLDQASAKEMGITELVGSQTTYFYGSDAARIQNITAAAARFHGVLVAPGETFSMAALMGDVSLDTGYAEAWIIYGDRTIKGVGGGVCQVSTTLFRTVFFAGYPVVERYPHAYRVSYYEYNAAAHIDESRAGLDATVFVPLVDFKFKNDTPYWILMETYVNAAARTITWKLYSTSDGRTVDWQTSGLTNVVEPPPPRYIENPDLAQDEIKQTDWAIAGADVDVTRTVSKDGGVLFTDRYTTHYLPWGDVYEYGPGTQLPEEEEQPQPEQ